MHALRISRRASANEWVPPRHQRTPELISGDFADRQTDRLRQRARQGAVSTSHRLCIVSVLEIAGRHKDTKRAPATRQVTASCRSQANDDAHHHRRRAFWMHIAWRSNCFEHHTIQILPAMQRRFEKWEMRKRIRNVWHLLIN